MVKKFSAGLLSPIVAAANLSYAQGVWDLKTDVFQKLYAGSWPGGPVPFTLDYFLVAGGGGSGGSSTTGGGGGAGGVLEGNITGSFGITYTVVTGAGGATNAPQYPSGGNTYFSYYTSGGTVYNEYTAVGGGYGGNQGSDNAGIGGSGGGGSINQRPGKAGTTLLQVQGYSGGFGGTHWAGGGGGAGGAGGSGGGLSAHQGFGGQGRSQYSVEWLTPPNQRGFQLGQNLGGTYWVAGGGGGATFQGDHATRQDGGAGGGGGGGRGGSGGFPSDSFGGTANTGGGAGGGAGATGRNSLPGGKGFAMFRVPNANIAIATTTGSPNTHVHTFPSAATPTRPAGNVYRFYNFTGSGSITFV